MAARTGRRIDRMAWATHQFTLILANNVPITDDVAEKHYGACDDTLLGMCNGAAYVDVDREADSFREAVLSAITEVESTGLRVERVEPGDFVTAAEIARRAGRTRESIRQLIRGERGPGSFPPPVSDITTRSPVWRWSDVAAWLVDQKILHTEESERALVTASVNAYLDWRRFARDPAAGNFRGDLQSLSGSQLAETASGSVDPRETIPDGPFAPIEGISGCPHTTAPNPSPSTSR
jgi:predicted DNA-binding transcriptional regulator AlpA